MNSARRSPKFHGSVLVAPGCVTGLSRLLAWSLQSVSCRMHAINYVKYSKIEEHCSVWGLRDTRKILALPAAGAVLLTCAALFVGALAASAAPRPHGPHPANGARAGHPPGIAVAHEAKAHPTVAYAVTALGATPPGQCSAAYFRGDPRLGPAQLPAIGPVGAELFGYQRTGGRTVARFLATYWRQSANAGQSGWIYPPDDGYVVGPNGHPEEGRARLLPGQDIDRFGANTGPS